MTGTRSRGPDPRDYRHYYQTIKEMWDEILGATTENKIVHRSATPIWLRMTSKHVGEAAGPTHERGGGHQQPARCRMT